MLDIGSIQGCAGVVGAKLMTKSTFRDIRGGQNKIDSIGVRWQRACVMGLRRFLPAITDLALSKQSRCVTRVSTCQSTNLQADMRSYSEKIYFERLVIAL